MIFGDIQTGMDICVSIDGTRMANCVVSIFVFNQNLVEQGRRSHKRSSKNVHNRISKRSAKYRRSAKSVRYRSFFQTPKQRLNGGGQKRLNGGGQKRLNGRV